MAGLYDYDKALKYEEEKVKNATFSKKNKELILKFKKHLLAEGIGKPRIVRYMITLRKVAEWYDKPFDEWDVEDMVEIASMVEERDYTNSTKNEFRKGLRKFFKWLKGEKWEGLKYVKGEKKNNNVPEILTEDEILKMIDVVEHPRDKALIAVGYEGGLRIGELAGLRIRDVEFLSAAGHLKAKIKVSGKTGERKIPLVMSVRYLKAWLDVHPRKGDPSAVVFCSISNRKLGQPMEYQSFSKILKRAAKKAGIKKRVYPHILRHSRATVLAQYLTESVLCEYFGWVQGSDIPRIYVHLSGRDLDKAIDSLYGIEVEEKPKVVRPRKCPRCGHVNEPTAKYCSQCALILDEGERITLEMDEAKFVEEMLAVISQNPQVLEAIKKMYELAMMRQKPEVVEELLEVMKSN